MQHDVFETQFDVKFVGNSGVFEGYASVFDETDSVRDRVAAGAFAQSLTRYRSENRFPPLLWQHDSKEPIGAWRLMREDAHGLFVRGELFVADIPRAKQAYKLLREGVVTGLSIGYRAVQSHYDSAAKARVLTEVDLHEVSLVTFPALASARISAVKAALEAGQMPDVRAFEHFLRDAGFSRRQAKSIVAGGYKQSGSCDAALDETEAEIDMISALTEKLRSLTPHF